MKVYQDKNWLDEKLHKEGLSVSQIAKECGTGLTTISRWAARFDIRKIKHKKGRGRGPENPYWKGGRYKDHTSGYILVYSPNHPFASKKGYVREHRLVVENFLGRHLQKNELVHHKNGVKDDNRIENLEVVLVLGGGQHYGNIHCPFCNKNFKVK